MHLPNQDWWEIHPQMEVVAYMQRPLGAGKPEDRFPFQTKVGTQSEDKVPRKSIGARPIEWGS